MPLFSSGVGGYGSIGGMSKGAGLTSRPAAGNSKMMPAKSIAQVTVIAKQHTDNFVANGRMVNRGATGKSRISVKA